MILPYNCVGRFVVKEARGKNYSLFSIHKSRVYDYACLLTNPVEEGRYARVRGRCSTGAAVVWYETGDSDFRERVVGVHEDQSTAAVTLENENYDLKHVRLKSSTIINKIDDKNFNFCGTQRQR